MLGGQIVKRADADSLFLVIDANSDGEISKKEFAVLVEKMM